MDLHPGENVIYDGHPSWRSVMSLYLQGALAGLVLGAIAWFACLGGDGRRRLRRCLAIAFVIGLVRRLFVRFTITDQRLHIKRGIIARHVQQTRIDRVQNVNTHQSPVERLLRVGKVDFDTAGTDDASFTFDGVNDPAEVVAAVDKAQRAQAQASAAASRRSRPRRASSTATGVAGLKRDTQSDGLLPRAARAHLPAAGPLPAVDLRRPPGRCLRQLDRPYSQRLLSSAVASTLGTDSSPPSLGLGARGRRGVDRVRERRCATAAWDPIYDYAFARRGRSSSPHPSRPAGSSSSSRS